MTSRSVRFLLASLFALTFSFTNAFGQGSKMKSPYDPIEEKDRDRPDLRDQWMMRGREAPKGKSAAALRLKAHQHKMAMRALREAAAAKAGAAAPDAPAVTNWVPLGPAPLATWPGQSYGNVTGRITSVAMDPTDPNGNTVYVGGAFGGVWRSANAATANPADVTWTPLTDQQAALAVGAISIKPDGSVLLVGTGEANNALANYYGLGFLRSTDGGANWNLISTASGGTLSLAGLGVSNMAWGTTTGLMNTVVAAVGFTPEGFDEGNFTSSSKRGVYASTDGGSTWTYEVPTDGTVSSNSTDIVFNAKANGGAGAYFAAIRWHGVYTSTNGTTWTRMTTQPGTLLTLTNCPSGSNATNTCPMYRGQFAVVPLRNEMYFWFVDPGDGDQGIWKSTNGGGSWQRILDNGITNCSQGGPPGEASCGTAQAFYNLEIAAVPDGTGTDLYAGTVNLYKCKLASGGTSCLTLDAGIGADWVNLTHVYGCNPIANIAHVHPDEHGLDFRVIGGKAVMYFGNDGGVYRALDGFTGLKSGTCTAPNTSAGVGFENLNTGTLGSLTQFVSFSIHPTDQNTVLGGTQDNGSPATATATSSAAWQTANFGDGGYNEINPDNPLQWFTAYTFVQIGVCNSGFGCDPITFFNNQIVTSTTLSGDEGAFYTPYILDPQNSGEMLVGTCRVWRGSTTGTGFVALSNTFDGVITCPGQGGQVDLVRGLAAGGPKSGGFSNVVYATTEGSGPNNGFVAGEVWATTNAAGGPAQFTNRTFNGPSGTINPNNYVISSAAVDKSDATGQTAYVGIMGFLGTGTHIWKTINAGTNWAPFGSTANGLPDSPVNALLVD
ncbi:MAG: exo-alpha-sialidase, partial [Acidobacteria bacterium]|nr:exo-alpha-sialidase [Acidobacteriota bacterium]